MNQGEELLKQISLKKRELVDIAMIKGIGDVKTIKCSQELDEMINSFYRHLKLLCEVGK